MEMHNKTSVGAKMEENQVIQQLEVMLMSYHEQQRNLMVENDRKERFWRNKVILLEDKMRKFEDGKHTSAAFHVPQAVLNDATVTGKVNFETERHLDKLEHWFYDMERELVAMDGFENRLHRLELTEKVEKSKLTKNSLEQRVVQLEEERVLMESMMKNRNDEIGELKGQIEIMKLMIQKLMRQVHSNQSEITDKIQGHVSTITQQVASVTKKYITVRIQDNNKLVQNMINDALVDQKDINDKTACQTIDSILEHNAA